MEWRCVNTHCPVIRDLIRHVNRFLRWYAVKLFERDEKVVEELKLDKALADHIDEHIKDCEKEMDDDAESIITNQRYSYINGVVDKAVKKKARVDPRRAGR